MLDLDSLFACVGVVGPLGVGGLSGCAGRLQAEPEVSVNRLGFIADSQSNGECTEAALRGDRGEYNPELETAGEAGSFMLGNTVGPAAGADRGGLEPRGVGGSFVLMGVGLGLFGPSPSSSAFSPSFSSLFSLVPSLDFRGHSQLTSDRAVEGALSI